MTFKKNDVVIKRGEPEYRGTVVEFHKDGKRVYVRYGKAFACWEKLDLMEPAPPLGKVVVTESAVPGGVNVNIRCDCGKPLTVVNQYGMFCEDRHGEKESIEATAKLTKLLGMFGPSPNTEPDQ